MTTRTPDDPKAVAAVFATAELPSAEIAALAMRLRRGATPVSGTRLAFARASAERV
ncbi:MAG: hypothetical protein HYY95_07225 [Candidatus Rokubacteria bacterium]|nr:hypothetical protein [Candidatus Rokubacteria bacterium]MBI3105348.1 hypothetical protein [Candidatus Rokubacteria bacterium]